MAGTMTVPVMGVLWMSLLGVDCGCHCYGVTASVMGDIKDVIVIGLYACPCYGGSVDGSLISRLWQSLLWGFMTVPVALL